MRKVTYFIEGDKNPFTSLDALQIFLGMYGTDSSNPYIGRYVIRVHGNSIDPSFSRRIYLVKGRFVLRHER